MEGEGCEYDLLTAEEGCFLVCSDEKYTHETGAIKEERFGEASHAEDQEMHRHDESGRLYVVALARERSVHLPYELLSGARAISCSSICQIASSAIEQAVASTHSRCHPDIHTEQEEEGGDCN